MHQAHKIHLSNFLSGIDLVFGEKIETTSGALLDVKLPNDPVVGLSWFPKSITSLVELYFID